MLRFALAQINPTVGDLDGNVRSIESRLEEARAAGGDIVVFPELALTGYPPEDLLLKPRFIRENRAALERVVGQCRGLTAVVGFVDQREDLFNAAAVIHDGQVAGIHHKCFLPNYGVFDENRYFQAGSPLHTCVYVLNGVWFGVSICEDAWYPEGPHRTQAVVGNAQVVININASPFHAGKWREREQMLATRASDNACIFVYLNTVGGQDELIFDGHSLVVLPDGEVICRGRALEEELVLVDLDARAVERQELADPRRRKARLARGLRGAEVNTIELPTLARGRRKPLAPRHVEPLDRTEEIYAALRLGVRDYVNKNGFRDVVLGLSGGIDSALTATVAADALGAARVVGVSMPSAVTSPETEGDAAELARRLGIWLIEAPIRELYDTAARTLTAAFKELPATRREGAPEGLEPTAPSPRDVTFENLQARLRGNLLMALSNHFGWLVLNTGNKSELATGYCTLYGDMAGGFGVLKDVPKTVVYELAAYRNARSEVIPPSIIARPPTAELRPGQRDEDELPPYAVLDPILHAYVEEDRSLEEIVALGNEAPLVRRIIEMVDRNEYKRRQAPPGIKITPKAFGKDRRLPITNRYRDW